MASPFFEHATPYEHFEAVNDADLKIQMAIIEREIAMVESAYNLNMALAEYKVMTESGSFEDLQQLYKEAAEQREKGNDGIFQRILDMIGAIFQAISDLFTGKRRKDLESYANSSEAKNIQVSGNMDLDKANEGLNIVQRMFAKLKSGIKGNKDANGMSEEMEQEGNRLLEIGGKILGGTAATVTLSSVLRVIINHGDFVLNLKKEVYDCVNEAKSKGKTSFFPAMRGFFIFVGKFFKAGICNIIDTAAEASTTAGTLLRGLSGAIRGIPDSLSSAFAEIKDARNESRSNSYQGQIEEWEETLATAKKNRDTKMIEKAKKKIERLKAKKQKADEGTREREYTFNFQDLEEAKQKIADLEKEVEKLKNAKPVDEEKIDEVEQQIEDAKAEAEELEEHGRKDDDDDPPPPPGGGGGGNPPPPGGGGGGGGTPSDDDDDDPPDDPPGGGGGGGGNPPPPGGGGGGGSKKIRSNAAANPDGRWDTGLKVQVVAGNGKIKEVEIKCLNDAAKLLNDIDENGFDEDTDGSDLKNAKKAIEDWKQLGGYVGDNPGGKFIWDTPPKYKKGDKNATSQYYDLNQPIKKPVAELIKSIDEHISDLDDWKKDKVSEELGGGPSKRRNNDSAKPSLIRDFKQGWRALTASVIKTGTFVNADFESIRQDADTLLKAINANPAGYQQSDERKSNLSKTIAACDARLKLYDEKTTQYNQKYRTVAKLEHDGKTDTDEYRKALASLEAAEKDLRDNLGVDPQTVAPADVKRQSGTGTPTTDKQEAITEYKKLKRAGKPDTDPEMKSVLAQLRTLGINPADIPLSKNEIKQAHDNKQSGAKDNETSAIRGAFAELKRFAFPKRIPFNNLKRPAIITDQNTFTDADKNSLKALDDEIATLKQTVAAANGSNTTAETQLRQKETNRKDLYDRIIDDRRKEHAAFLTKLKSNANKIGTDNIFVQNGALVDSTALTESCAFGINLGSFVVTESCDDIDLSQYDVDIDNIFDDMKNL